MKQLAINLRYCYSSRDRSFIPGTHPPGMTRQEQHGSGLTASAPVSDISALAYTNGAWPLLGLVNVGQRNKQLTMLFFTVLSIDLLMDCTAWRFWMMQQSNGCSTPAPRFSVAKQWFERTSIYDKEARRPTQTTWWASAWSPLLQVFLPLVIQKPSFYIEKLKTYQINKRLECWKHGKLQELFSECEASQSRLNKSVKNKKQSHQKVFCRLIAKRQTKQALKLVNTAKDIGGTHVITRVTKQKLEQKHPKAQEVKEYDHITTTLETIFRGHEMPHSQQLSSN